MLTALSGSPDGAITGTTAGGGPVELTSAPETPVISVGGPTPVPATSTSQGFVGIATSYSTIPALTGSTTDVDTPVVNLLKSLSPGAPPLLRLGGSSADSAWWPTPGVKPDSPYLYKLSRGWAARVRTLLKAVGGKAIMGVNLVEPYRIDRKLPPVEVKNFKRFIGSRLIDSYEIGNEPELFGTGRFGPHVPAGDIPAYGRKFTRIASDIGSPPLAGPGSVGPRWRRQLGTVLGVMPPHLKLATVHAYPLYHCAVKSHLKVSDFFTSRSIQVLANSIHREAQAAAAHHEPLRVDEINGVVCGGAPGVSDTFGEALWALNVIPALWRAGVQGVNFQTVYGGHNQVIHSNHSAAGFSVSIYPEYYGLLAFAHVAPAGSRLLHVSDPGLSDFYEFAARAPGGAERVVLTNVGSAPRAIGVTASGTHGEGSLSLLTAKSLDATHGTTLGGQRVSSRTGLLTGTPKRTSIQPSAAGTYHVRVPAHAAAILTLST